MKLARVAGTLDVDAMLERMTPAKFNRWIAADRVDPWGNEDLILSWGFAELINTVRQALAGDSQPDLLPPDYFVPKPPKDDEPPEQPIGIVEAMRRRAGL